MNNYANKFQKLQWKTNVAERIPVANIVWQFLIGFNPAITPMVYAIALATLQAAIDTVKWYKAGFMITQLKTSNYAENEVTE